MQTYCGMGLTETLRRLGERHMAALPERDRLDFEDELDRLRMMRVAEDGLAVGDHLPDFALADRAGRTWTSQELLDRGPLVLALFRGGWCPYCELTMAALEEARPAIEALGASAVGIMPEPSRAPCRDGASARHQLSAAERSRQPLRAHVRSRLRAVTRSHPPPSRAQARLPAAARRHDLAPADPGGVRDRTRCAHRLRLQRRRSGVLARSRGLLASLADLRDAYTLSKR